MKKILIILIFCCNTFSFSQEVKNSLSLEEYLGYVKKYHPLLKQAKLTTSNGEAKLLKARGAFDPKIEVDYTRKNFKNTEYYNKLNTTFKIPTWYGIEFKANYENNDGYYLNPEFKTPEKGLYSAGVSVSLAKGLLINQRMAFLKQAKLYRKQSIEKQKLLVNEILYNAINSYFKWLKNYQTQLVYNNYLTNAKTRLDNVRKSFIAGDKPAVDTLEANINLKNRLLDLEKSKISHTKSKLELSNYLWLNNDLPLELSDLITPDLNTINNIDLVLGNSIIKAASFNTNNHPKLKALQLKKEGFKVSRKLKLNNLLPKIDLQYNFLTTDYQNINALSTSNYKGGLNVSLPLFLRKERADLKLANLKLKEIDFDISSTKVAIDNKIKSNTEQINSYKEQNRILNDLAKDYKQLLKSEERKFYLGEGSMFLVNYREVKSIENELKLIKNQFSYFKSKSTLLKTLNSFSL
ncbi:transporter [Tenacibaculum sp. E3R01]|uniref:TolC family protein n=1 Tax=Tenacibaculum sp. E3R01 TaxID=2267227 RepID=UPI000DEAF87F|nr:TolC family protein [Tenacibaculum sp. E3R01]RBW58121.1 transporter [Tenacibaculum sp. E3R01]